MDNDLGSNPTAGAVRNTGKTAKAGTFVNVVIEIGGKSIQTSVFLEGTVSPSKDVDLDKVTLKAVNVRGFDPNAPKDKAADFLSAI